MAINDVLSSLAQRLGLKMTELEDLRKLHSQLSDARKQDLDRVEVVREKVGRLDIEIEAKRAEYNRTKGMGQRFIIKGEYDRLVLEQKKSLEAYQLLSQRMENGLALIHALEQLILQKENRPTVETLDNIQFNIEDTLEEMREEQKTVDTISQSSFVLPKQKNEQKVQQAESNPLSEALGELPDQLGEEALPELL